MLFQRCYPELREAQRDFSFFSRIQPIKLIKFLKDLLSEALFLQLAMFILGNLGKRLVHPLLGQVDILCIVQILHSQDRTLYSMMVGQKTQMVGLVALN